VKSIVISLFALTISSVFGQSKNYPSELPAGKLYYYPSFQLLACQIDGDNSSGYNKLGYQLSLSSGLKLEKNKTIELMMGISERGSRRSYNVDDPSVTAFHLHYNALDLGLYYGWVFDNKLHVSAGLHGQYLLSITESEGFSNNLELDYDKFGLLLDVYAKYPVGKNFAVTASFNYSLMSLLKSTVSNPTFYQGAGVYHNVLGLGIVWIL
jgi:hypothetical protein